jgi:hypothetical protein
MPSEIREATAKPVERKGAEHREGAERSKQFSLGGFAFEMPFDRRADGDFEEKSSRHAMIWNACIAGLFARAASDSQFASKTLAALT